MQLVVDTAAATAQGNPDHSGLHRR
jgi:hypothetical protein